MLASISLRVLEDRLVRTLWKGSWYSVWPADLLIAASVLVVVREEGRRQATFEYVYTNTGGTLSAIYTEMNGIGSGLSCEVVLTVPASLR